MKVPFTWKVTGGFMIGWSPEFPFGEAAVADVCTVVGDCVECPFHGWRWGPNDMIVEVEATLSRSR